MMTTPIEPPTGSAPAADDAAPGTAGGPGRRAMLLGLLWDVGLSIVTYYVLHLLGANDWVALLAAAAAAGVRIVWSAVRDHELNAFATVMLLVWAIGLVLSFASGDPRFLLLKESITTGSVGVAFLVSVVVGRPLTLAAAKRWEPARAAELDRLVATVPAALRVFKLSGLVWGVGLLIESAVRVPLIFTLPIDVMVGLSTVLLVVALVALFAWNQWYVARVRRRVAGA